MIVFVVKEILRFESVSSSCYEQNDRIEFQVDSSSWNIMHCWINEVNAYFD